MKLTEWLIRFSLYVVQHMAHAAYNQIKLVHLVKNQTCLLRANQKEKKYQLCGRVHGFNQKKGLKQESVCIKGKIKYYERTCSNETNELVRLVKHAMCVKPVSVTYLTTFFSGYDF